MFSYLRFDSFIFFLFNLKGRVDLDFLPPAKNMRGSISITGSVTDKNYVKQSQPEMSFTDLQFHEILTWFIIYHYWSKLYCPNPAKPKVYVYFRCVQLSFKDFVNSKCISIIYFEKTCVWSLFHTCICKELLLKVELILVHLLWRIWKFSVGQQNMGWI